MHVGQAIYQAAVPFPRPASWGPPAGPLHLLSRAVFVLARKAMPQRLSLKAYTSTPLLHALAPAERPPPPGSASLVVLLLPARLLLAASGRLLLLPPHKVVRAARHCSTYCLPYPCRQVSECRLGASRGLLARIFSAAVSQCVMSNCIMVHACTLSQYFGHEPRTAMAVVLNVSNNKASEFLQ